MKSFADLSIVGTLALSQNLTSFPIDPIDGQFALVNGALYVWTTIDGSLAWYPLVNEKAYYKHTQTSSSTTSGNYGIRSMNAMSTNAAIFNFGEQGAFYMSGWQTSGYYKLIIKE